MYKNILVPLALDHGISEITLSAAQTLCSEGGKITALHVYEVPRGTVSAFMGEQYIRAGLEAAQKLLIEKTNHIEGVTAEIVRGHAYRSIVEYAEKGGFDCIVIGSHKPGLSEFLIGSTAARVVRHASCSVLVHRT